MGSWAWKVIAILSTIGGLTAYLVFWPQFDISEGAHPREENPIGIPFVLSNKGILPLYPREVICWIYHLESEFGATATTVGFIHESAGVLNGGDTVDFVPKFTPINFKERISSADLLIIAQYRTVWGQTKDKRVRFSVTRDTEGQLRYIRKYLTGRRSSISTRGTCDCTNTSVGVLMWTLALLYEHRLQRLELQILSSADGAHLFQ